ncbi:SDR family oxidoreductase [Hydrogenophaga sp. BPS33]|uniref:SDR family oxidoreductase n=1 Tax=Hydrogenophaga sp. BPS33 TaxID=2651974 RepID=UPI0013202852|nr:SDR family oxidoreductase [Hydrogenophaga sp. BPS33]QHE87818.1 SDR family oxidoreductase [Hydrogenophaga sp. BPS33]
MKPNTLLIAGATGIVGHAAIEHFSALPDWNVVTLSRRAPPAREGVRHLSADLTDAAACQQAVALAPDITHVLYAALYEKPQLLAGWTDPEQIEVNRSMLRHLLDALALHAPGLRHVALLQGTKAYGSHVGRVPVPAKERWPRLPHPIFYWQQEDLLRERQRHADWSFTILRPQIVLGYAQASPMNVIAAIGAYAAIQQERGLPLSFPGGGRYVNACSDSRLIARAVEWAGQHPNAANETFNVVNGDVLVWQDIWPSIATHLGMPVGEDAPLELARDMPRHEDVWSRIVQRHGLQPTTLAGLVGSSWQFADRNLAYGQATPDDRIVSPIKLRQAGFADCIDTEDAVLYWLDRMRKARLLPPGPA